MARKLREGEMKPRKIVQVATYLSSDGERVYAVADDGSLWKGRVVFDNEIDPPDWGWKWAAIPPLPPIEEPEGEEKP